MTRTTTYTTGKGDKRNLSHLHLLTAYTKFFARLIPPTYENIILTLIVLSLNKTKAAVSNLSEGLRTRVETAREREQEFRKIFRLETNGISDRVESGVSKVSHQMAKLIPLELTSKSMCVDVFRTY